MRKITFIIIHCSATREDREYSFEECLRDHVIHRRFTDIGYHYYITRDGEVLAGRPLYRKGAHCRNHNAHSIGICYEGGLTAQGKPADTRTPLQKAALRGLIGELQAQFPQALVVGHSDLNPLKECPCFDVVKEYN